LERLAGKTIAFFGGWRRMAAKELPCTILLHVGKRHDPSFYSALKEADAYVVWTEFISHESMWEIKEWAAERGAPAYYLRGMNLELALNSISFN
jgi:hypothetical protein